jgi:hypothetical protein
VNARPSALPRQETRIRPLHLAQVEPHRRCRKQQREADLSDAKGSSIDRSASYQGNIRQYFSPDVLA